MEDTFNIYVNKMLGGGVMVICCFLANDSIYINIYKWQLDTSG